MPKFIIRAHHETKVDKTMEVTAINAKDALTSFYILTSKQGLDFDKWAVIDIEKMPE